MKTGRSKARSAGNYGLLFPQAMLILHSLIGSHHFKLRNAVYCMSNLQVQKSEDPAAWALPPLVMRGWLSLSSWSVPLPTPHPIAHTHSTSIIYIPASPAPKTEHLGPRKALSSLRSAEHLESGPTPPLRSQGC